MKSVELIEIPQRIDWKKGERMPTGLKVLATLGEGAFGKVYKVEDNKGTVYALKILRLWDVSPDIRQALIERFEMEFRTGQINSPYLVHSIDYGFIKGNPYIKMEFCPGGDLASRVGNKELNISKVASDILHGLHDLHKNGKIHRDLKLENILFKPDGTAALTDFGIVGDVDKRKTGTDFWGRPIQIFGTYAYMPPEASDPKARKQTVLPTRDIFSFGVMIYQLLTGELPFGKLEDHDDLVNYQKRIKVGDWDRGKLKKIPDGKLWKELLEGCLKPDYKERIQEIPDIYKLIPYIEKPEALNSKERDSKQIIKGARLRVMHGDGYGMVYDLTDMSNQMSRLNITLGRQKNNQIVLLDPCVSRGHCTIETDLERLHWCIRDGQWNRDTKKWEVSSNGTYVNSTEVKASGFWLETDDIISIGNMKFRYEQY